MSFSLPRRATLLGALVALVAFAPQTEAQDLDATISAVQSGLTEMAPAAAVENIDGWIEALEGSDQAIFRNLAHDLGDLKAELQRSNPRAQLIGHALVRVGERTAVSGFYADGMTAQKLRVLGSALKNAGRMLISM